MNILHIDIETSPVVAYVWALHDQNISVEQIIEDWTILSVGWAWGDGPVQYASVAGQKNVRDDKKLLKLLHELLDKADLVVAHNGAKFDVRKIRARMLVHGMTPTSPFKVFDTCLIARKVAGFTSNKLAWLSVMTGVGKEKHKKFPGFELWIECLAGNKAAWDEMERYNRQDVRALRALYHRLRPWAAAPSELAVEGVDTCPRCGSKKLAPRGTVVVGVSRYQRFKCDACGGWTRSRKAVSKRETLREEA